MEIIRCPMIGGMSSLNKLTHMRGYRGRRGLDRHWMDSFPKVLAQPQCESPVLPSLASVTQAPFRGPTLPDK